MLDKVKALLDMQKKMQQLKEELDNTDFEATSPDGLVKVTMNGSQQVKQVNIAKDLSALDKAALEKAVADAYNKAVRRSQEIAASKMKALSGLNLPGL